MTVSNPHLDDRVTPPQETWGGEDEIDLRQYIRILLAWWREMLTLALLAAILTAAAVIGLRFLQTPVYRASATVAIARTTSSVNFDDRFQTSTSDQSLNFSQRVDILAGTRRAALVGLVYNGAVAETVVTTLRDQLDEIERNPSVLLRRIEAEIVMSEGSRIESDLIRISARGSSPEKAAALANVWALAYVDQVNTLYGQVPDNLLASVQAELSSAQGAYDEAQRRLENFISENDVAQLERLIAEKTDIIESLQQGKQMAIRTLVDEELNARRQIISAYISAQASNRLLAFNKEQDAKQNLIATLISSEFSNRLTALQKDQEARRQLFVQAVQAEIDNRLLAVEKDQEVRSRIFAQYVDTEIANRLKALAQEQQAKGQIFDAYADADTRAKIAVFNEQVNARLQTLAKSYETKLKLERLASDASALRAQAAEGGEAAAATNGLALLLLKSEVYGTGTGTPGNLQLVLDNLDSLNAGAEGQVADLDALLDVLTDRIAELEVSISDQSQMLLANEGYSMLETVRPDDDPLFAALQQKYLDLFDIGDLAQAADGVENTTLSQAIQTRYEDLFAVSERASAADNLWQDSELQDTVQEKYQELFGLSSLAVASMVISDTTPLASMIQDQYPNLFSVGDISALTELVAEDNDLSLLGEERAKELLQLQGLEDIPTYTAASAPLTQAIDALEDEIQDLRAQREAETARRDQLIRDRDLKLSSLTALNNKNAEFRLADTAVNSEVRFATPALPPLGPESGPGLILTTVLGGVVGAMVAIFIALFASFMGAQPFFTRPKAIHSQ